jgi:hypothetical protein
MERGKGTGGHQSRSGKNEEMKWPFIKYHQLHDTSNIQPLNIFLLTT